MSKKLLFEYIGKVVILKDVFAAFTSIPVGAPTVADNICVEYGIGNTYE
jgi:hypothetical protein